MLYNKYATGHHYKNGAFFLFKEDMLMKKIAIVVAVGIFIVLSVINVFGVYEGTYSLPKNQTWVSKGEGSVRYTSDSYINTKLLAVYPQDGGKDNYRYCQVRYRGYSSGHTFSMTNTVKLDERTSGYTKIYIEDGYLSHKKVTLNVRGNNPDCAAFAELRYIAN